MKKNLINLLYNTKLNKKPLKVVENKIGSQLNKTIKNIIFTSIINNYYILFGTELIKSTPEIKFSKVNKNFSTLNNLKIPVIQNVKS